VFRKKPAEILNSDDLDAVIGDDKEEAADEDHTDPETPIKINSQKNYQKFLKLAMTCQR
jgi:hypothetical protein